MERLRELLAEVETAEDPDFDNEDNGPEDVSEENFSDHESFCEHDTESKEDGNSGNEDHHIIHNLLHTYKGFTASAPQKADDISFPNAKQQTISHRPVSAGKQSPTLLIQCRVARKMTKWGVRWVCGGVGIRCAWVDREMCSNRAVPLDGGKSFKFAAGAFQNVFVVGATRGLRSDLDCRFSVWFVNWGLKLNYRFGVII
ncbi:hypothetical protein AVEN_58329-1 [Araneus ventricosus]|uniref:Uncharacterized protein n=1 Tax=Araneus ventricosus TaxID=182803 RepID=A0A4Y2CPY1_ARAVE|nr:hypothetical protein AVEN_58329-1 [Araneus ventricosus]